ncbi:hypothetical protein Hypma_006960 [Hypsizygus marmoreus]|uniref:Uncharacterized protein n=1 Tax=Hypsizygus marmoreus TaxID=39966 RepID=A0A369JTW9_HYPMA|nr:hypothetical protein Hypma_006960 [Hypsizygus marmoreus]
MDSLVLNRPRSHLTFQALRTRPSRLLGSQAGPATMDSQHVPPAHRLNPYQRALLSYERADKRRSLHLARETRRALLMEEKLAVQLVKEAEVMVDILQSDAKKAHLRVEEATLEIGTVRAALEKEGILETTLSNPDDDEFTFEFGPNTSDPVSDDEESNTSDSEASGITPTHTTEEHQHVHGNLTEEALTKHNAMSAVSETV